MNITYRVVIAVALIASITTGSVGWYLQTSSADLTPAELERFVDDWHADNGGNGHLFVSQEELKNAHEVINESIAAPHTQYATIDDYETLQKQIFNIRGDMVRKHPTTPAEDPINEGRKLTVTLVNDIIFLGQSIVIKGDGEPNRPVFAFASAPNRSIQGATVADENGFWLIDIDTSFDDTAGTWSIRVTQDQFRAEPIVITVR